MDFIDIDILLAAVYHQRRWILISVDITFFFKLANTRLLRLNVVMFYIAVSVVRNSSVHYVSSVVKSF